MKFIHDKFLLSNRTAQKLYQRYAEPEPIFDYHCHLPPGDIAENRQFKNLFEIWLEGDHYKWRAMRANGVSEDYCTGAVEPFEKFRAWAATVPHTLRNPLYHWTHLELSRYFGIEELLDEESAARIWKEANRQLATPAFSTQGILKKFRVTALCTTDCPTDDLRAHEKIAASGAATGVYPAFRPDKALNVDQPARLNPWVAKLEEVADTEIATLDDFLGALAQRHQYFHAHGCRLSDHGLNQAFAAPCGDKTVAGIFARARKGKAATPEEHAQFATYLMLFFGRLDADQGWVKQLHLGALRGVNSRLQRRLGPDVGFDSINDVPQAAPLARYLDMLDGEGKLPRMIIYNLNPADNYAIATMLGNFNDGSIAGKVQMGSGWWFLDQKEGMEWQLNALSNNGLLSRFVGMVTDSRSFMSYPRHEYFRRVLCNVIGRDVEEGDLPDDETLLGPLIRNICHANSRDFLRLPPLGARASESEGKNARSAARRS
ncbi:MAG TPA: glucuronate isomerase [Verrucomicrobiae bacterium]|jgi:glucuronate isomerase|nr:glucuronate isomerase [Verrucomicrobiae bacterium]